MSSVGTACNIIGSEFCQYKPNFWRAKYEDLKRWQDAENKHPIHASGTELREANNRFKAVFEGMDDYDRREVASLPLFSDPSKFAGDYCADIETTKPLHYIMFTGDFAALEMITPYLDRDDFLAFGSYQSSFFHYVINGFQELAVGIDDSPVKCIKFLLYSFPELRSRANQSWKTPLEYAREVQENMEGTLDKIEKYGTTGFGGFGRHITFYDGISESSEDYTFRLPYLEKIIELLSDPEKLETLSEIDESSESEEEPRGAGEPSDAEKLAEVTAGKRCILV